MSKAKPSSDQHGKGSIVLEILAVLLAAALIFTLTYPAKLWKAEDANILMCRENMQHIYYAELTYLDNFLVYNDTLEKVVRFILDDTSGRALKRFTNLDSVLGQQIIKSFKGKKDLVTITIDSALTDDPDSLVLVKHTKRITVANLVDSMLIYTRAVDLDTSEAYILDSLRVSNEAFAQLIDGMAQSKLNNLFSCPTNGKPYLITVNNDSSIKQITIACPIDSIYALGVNKDFKRGFLGGLRVENHGNIENGKLSWKN